MPLRQHGDPVFAKEVTHLNVAGARQCELRARRRRPDINDSHARFMVDDPERKLIGGHQLHRVCAEIGRIGNSVDDVCFPIRQEDEDDAERDDARSGNEVVAGGEAERGGRFLIHALLDNGRSGKSADCDDNEQERKHSLGHPERIEYLDRPERGGFIEAVVERIHLSEGQHAEQSPSHKEHRINLADCRGADACARTVAAEDEADPHDRAPSNGRPQPRGIDKYRVRVEETEIPEKENAAHGCYSRGEEHTQHSEIISIKDAGQPAR